MARDPAWNGRGDTVARHLAAIVGTLVPSTLAVALIARSLPLDEALAVVTGGLMLPFIWMTAVWLVYLLPTARRAWAAVLVATAIAAGVMVLVGPMPTG
ncbi:MAG: hypothetical protein AAGN82_26480 [Myxococcota bacterium]